MKFQINMGRLKFFRPNIISNLVLILLLIIFVVYITFLAFNLKLDIVPDEAFHFSMSQTFAKTLGVPYETQVSLERGIFMRQNPYLAYWFYGRALNLLSIINPNASHRQQLVFLRLFNVAFSIGTTIVTYFFAKELNLNKWYSLLPVFLLTNSLMFVLLSSGVSYDNPANFFSIVSILFLTRILKNKEFIINSLAMFISLSFGTLIKFSIVPLAAGMIIVWVYYIISKHPEIDAKRLIMGRNLLLFFLILLLVGLNISIYGVNLVKFQSLVPTCRDYYTEEFCRNSPFLITYYNLFLPEKLTVFSAVRQGYPEPIRYAFNIWIRDMLVKIFGIMGNLKSYYPDVASYFHLLLYWFILLLVRYYKKTTYMIYNLFLIFFFYAVVLFIRNYDSELTFGFARVALQGRYIFPVISLAYGLISYGLMKVPNRIVKYTTLSFTVALFLYGGPLKFITYYSSRFADWFV